MGQGQQQQKIKGNPASKRMVNAKLKARRAASWAKDRDPETGVKLKHLRNREQQAVREKANERLRAQGLPKPWEVSLAQRVQRRAELRDARAGKPKPKRGRAA